MENNGNRRLLIAVGFVLFFVIIVLVWYFFYAKPVIAPSLNETNNPLPTRIFPPGFQFLNWGTENPTSTTEVTDPAKDPLVKVWSKPSTGQTFISDQVLKEILATSTDGTTTFEVKKTIRATSTVLLFVDRATGYVYGYPLETGAVFQISNTIIPGVYDAYFFDNGKRLIIRYIDQEKNTVVGLIANVPHVEQTGSALPLENIEYLTFRVMSVAVSGTKSKASYVVANEGGSAVYTVDASKNPQLMASSPFREWSISYGGEALYVTTKPSAYIEGATLSLPFFHAEITDKTGLMSAPSDGGVLLNSMWGKTGLATFLSADGNVQLLSIKTLASKCGWGKHAFLVCAVPKTLQKGVEGLPDDWFQGRVSFNDDFFQVDVTTGEAYTLYSFEEAVTPFDVVGITVLDTNDIFSFNKKQDGSLWLLNLNLLPRE